MGTTNKKGSHWALLGGGLLKSGLVTSFRECSLFGGIGSFGIGEASHAMGTVIVQK